MWLLLEKAVVPGVLLASGLVASIELRDVSRSAADKGEIERGRYLVEDVAKCGECHTPRDAQGQLDHSAWLQGAPIWIMPVRPIANWAEHAPALAGFPSFTRKRASAYSRRALGQKGRFCIPRCTPTT